MNEARVDLTSMRSEEWSASLYWEPYGRAPTGEHRIALSSPMLETRQCGDVKIDHLSRGDETVPGGRKVLADPEEGITENSRATMSCHMHDGEGSDSRDECYRMTDLFKINPINGMPCDQ